MIRPAAFLTAVLFSTQASAKPRLEISANGGLLLGSPTSPVVYAPSPTARIPGDPGAILGGRAAPYRAGSHLGGAIAIAFGDVVSIGLDGAVHRFGADAPNDGTRDVERSGWSLGPFVRATLPTDTTLRPYLSLGVRHLSDKQRWSRPSPIPDVTEHWTVEHRGTALPVAIGVDAMLGRYFAVGPVFGVTYVSPTSACAMVHASDPRFVPSEFCDDAPVDKRVISTDAYAFWTLGVAIRALPF